MAFEPELDLRFIISISLALLFQYINLHLAYSFLSFLYLFIDEFRIFSHLGFTYTTYTTVKREFLIL